MKMNDIDSALHEIRLMVAVAIGATESLVGSDVESGYFHMRRRMQT